MPKIEKTAVVKVPLQLSLTDEHQLDGQSRICNWLYNQLLDHANRLREQFRETQNPEIVKTLYTERGLRNLIPSFKERHPFLKVVHSSPLKNAALRVSSAIREYQKSRKGKRKGSSGWPRFRSWSRGWFSLLYDEPNKGFKIEGSQLTLSLGKGIARDQRYVKARLETILALKGKDICQLRIVKQLGKWFAVFTVKVSLPTPQPIHKAIALDPNHKNLAYGVGSDQQAVEIAAPSWIKKLDRRVDELRAKRDCCKRRSQKVYKKNEAGENLENFFWKASRRWIQLNRLLEDVLRKRREQTKTFLFTAAQALFEHYDLVSIGDYAPDGSGSTTAMRRAMNNRSLICRFKETLSWVALKSGKHFHIFDEKGTTRTCHRCAYVVDGGLAPHIRDWKCPACSSQHIRDENAAKNGLRKTLRDLNLKQLVPGSGRASVEKRWAWCVLPSGVVSTLRGQSSDPVATPRNSNGNMVVSDQSHLIRFA